MGNNSSVAQSTAGLFFYTEHTDFYPGDTLNGKLYISLQEDLEEPCLMLIFKGKECAQLNNPQSPDSKRTIRKMNFHTPIHTWKEGLRPGSYTIPIYYILPSELTGSCSFHHGWSGKIEYILQFKLISQNFSSAYKSGLFIKQRPEITENLTGDTRMSVVSCSCIGKGESQFKVTLPKNAFETNEDLPVHIDFESNNKSLRLWNFEVSLNQCLSIKIHEFVKRKEICVWQASEYGEGCAFPKDFRISLQSIRKHLDDRYSTNGEIAFCSYFVRVKVNVGGGCLSLKQDAVVDLPVNILPNVIMPPPLPPSPSGWNPVNVNPIYIAYNPDKNNLEIQNPQDSFFDFV